MGKGLSDWDDIIFPGDEDEDEELGARKEDREMESMFAPSRRLPSPHPEYGTGGAQLISHWRNNSPLQSVFRQLTLRNGADHGHIDVSFSKYL